LIIIQNKKYWMGLFLACLFLLVVCPVIVNAQPPFTQVNLNLETGLEIEYPKFFYFSPSDKLLFYFHVYNKSDGNLINNDVSSCGFHLYNSTGHEVVENTSIARSDNLIDFFVEINETYTSKVGTYSYIVGCNTSVLGAFVSTNIFITYNGEEPPSDFVKVFFIISFIAILILIIVTIFLLVKHSEKYDVGLMDVIYMFSIYFAVYSLKYFNMEYMGSYLIDSFSDMFITVGAFTHIIIPIIMFIVCFMKRRLEQKKEDY